MNLLIQAQYPKAEEYLHEAWFFDEMVKLGMLSSSDYDNKNLNELAFRLNSHIAKNYLRIDQRILDEVSLMLNGTNSNSLVGVHIRLGDSTSDLHESAQFLFPSDIRRFITCSIVKDNSNSAVYVASDAQYAKRIIANSTSMRVVYIKEKTVHSWYEVRTGRPSNAVHLVLIDIVALSRCRVIIGTKSSSLTYFAAMLQGKWPYYVTRNTDCYYPHNLTTIINYCCCFHTHNKGATPHCRIFNHHILTRHLYHHTPLVEYILKHLYIYPRTRVFGSWDITLPHYHPYAHICMHMHTDRYICIHIHAESVCVEFWTCTCMHLHACVSISVHMHAYG